MDSSFTFSAPGRTEICGNHTDHQHGCVLAAAINLDTTAEVRLNGRNAICIYSEGYAPFEIKLDDLAAREDEKNTTAALVRGVAAAFAARGCDIHGFDAKIHSSVLPGSGLSSSAAFEVLIGRILNGIFFDGRMSDVEIAQIGQYAECEYFGKPCGIMSHLASAMGHTVYADPKTGEIEQIRASFAPMGLTMCLTNTGGSHAGLDTSYARIPADMVYIANLFDKGVLADVDPKEFYSKGWDPANRPVRRAMHFFGENERVPKMRDALKAGDGETYMRLMNESGRSSEQLLNNIVTSATGDTKLEQGLELSKTILEGRGAWRVHGGGFAGCVQALMPTGYFRLYKSEMERVFGYGSCMEITII